MNLHTTNLNLLVAFDILMKERHVSKAAEKMFITQSAASKCLNHLRDLFHDPLLVRTPKGMVPTERALQLQPEVRKILQSTEELFIPQEAFDPSEFAKSIHLGMPDAVADFILPTLIEKLEKFAPKVRLHIHDLQSEQLRSFLLEDEIQLAITYGYHLPETCKTTMLVNDKLVVMARCSHPIMRFDSVRVEEYLKYQHIVMIYTDAPVLPVDDFLIARGYPPRQIALTVRSAMTILPILTKSDYLFLINEQFAKAFAKNFKLAYKTLAEMVPATPLHLVWSEVYDKSIWHCWLRDFIKNHCSKI